MSLILLFLSEKISLIFSFKVNFSFICFKRIYISLFISNSFLNIQFLTIFDSLNCKYLFVLYFFSYRFDKDILLFFENSFK